MIPVILGCASFLSPWYLHNKMTDPPINHYSERWVMCKEWFRQDKLICFHGAKRVKGSVAHSPAEGDGVPQGQLRLYACVGQQLAEEFDADAEQPPRLC